VAQIDRSMAFGLVAAEGGVVDVQVARAVELRLRRDDPLLQGPQRHQDLEAAAGRVLSLDDAVHEGRQRVLAQLRPGGRLDPLGELVGVVGWRRDHGQDLAVAGIEGHGAARAARHRLLEGLLQLHVDREAHARPLHRGLTLRLRHLHAAAVHHHAPQAVPAHEQAVVLGLDTRLPHRDPRIDPRVGLRRQLPLRDLAHPPQDVRRPLAERIGAQGDRVHAGLGLLQPAGLDGGHVLLGGVGLHHHRAELRALLLREPLADVREVHGHQLGEPPHAAVHVVGLLGGEHDVERRPVVHQHAPVAIEDQSPRGRDRHGTDTVVLRQVAVVLAAQHLELPEVHRQQPHQPHHHPLDDGQAALEPAQVLVDPHGRLRRPR
jgi:hypothetical protein